MPHFREFGGKIKIMSIHNLLSYVEICSCLWKIATFCPINVF